MAGSSLLLSLVFLALTVSSGVGGGSSEPMPGGSGRSSTEVTKDFAVASTGVSVSRTSNSEAVEVDMSSITQSGSVTVTQ